MPIAPVVGASMIGAGASLVGGLLGLGAQDSANETNIQIARENRDWQEKLWNMQNAYNTPANQLSLYRQAGVNPLTAIAEMNGNSSAGSLGTPNMPTVNPTDYSFLNQAGQQIMNGLVAKAQIDNLNADTTGKRIKNNYSPQQYEAEIKQLQATADKLHQETENALAEYDNIRKSGQKIDAETGQITANTEKTKVEAETINASREKVLAKLDAEINNLNEQLRLMPYEAKTRRISAQAMATQSNAAKQQASLMAQRWEIEKDKIIPDQIKQVAERTSELIAQRKQAEAYAYLAKQSADIQKSKPDWWKEWFSADGYIGDICKSVGNAVGVVMDARMKGALSGAARQNADTNARNATVNEQRLQQPPSYGYSYGTTGSWNP